MGWRHVIAHLERSLGESGLDIVFPFRAATLQRVVGHDASLSAADNDDLVVLVGNSRALWAPFLTHVRR